MVENFFFEITWANGLCPPQCICGSIFPDGHYSFVEGRRALARAQRPHQAFSLLIFWNSLTNGVIWHQDPGESKGISGLVLIREMKCVFSWKGDGEDVSKYIFSSVQINPNPRRAPHFYNQHVTHCNIL